MTKPILDAVLVAAGKYHDIDFARLELLKLLAEHENLRVRVAADYADTDAIARAKFLVTYTCDVRPSEAQQEALAKYVESGGRWVALHGTNAALDFTAKGVAAPRVIGKLAHTLGSQFIAHPPIQPYRVKTSAPSHPLVSGVGEFDTDDELYLSEYHEREKLTPLLETEWTGTVQGWTEPDWTHTKQHLVMYLRPLGKGCVLYNTLGHCRGHYDMRPVTDYYPTIERCSWGKPQYYELLRRSLRWALGELA
jgi:hypothetical protein